MISISMEVMVVALGIMLVVGKKKMYGWCIALTFLLYIFYDLVNLLSLHLSQDSLEILFFMATLSILWAIWNIFLEAVGQSSIGPAEDLGIDPRLDRAEGQWVDGQTAESAF
jgi:hypothetical protein